MQEHDIVEIASSISDEEGGAIKELQSWRNDFRRLYKTEGGKREEICSD